jgi:hypothetical protein
MNTTDLRETERFLALLAEAEAVTFQTFSDKAETKVKKANGAVYDPLAHIRHGSLEAHAPELLKLNRGTAGVFIAVNATDGRGRTAKNVVRVRALFGDLDGAPLPQSWGLEPHLVIESSPRRFHCYWRVSDCPLEQFTPTQKAIAAKLGGDPSVHDLPRVMRLPGFLHQKAEPFLTHIIHENLAQPYALTEVINGLGLEPATGETRTGPKLGDDPILKALSDQKLLKGPLHGKAGAWDVLCPWRASHTVGEEGTAYFEPHTNGYAGPGFRCLHAHCENRTIADLLRFLTPVGAADNPDESGQPELVVRRVADVKTTLVKWLWKDRIALGKITFLVGDPDEGKSYLTTAMAAHVTRGNAWPDGAPCDKGSVILISAEDDVSDTIRPRLEACGADLDKVHFIETVNLCKHGKKVQRLFSLQEDLDALSGELERMGDVKLVEIDPISAFLGECDSHVNAEVRGLMGPLAKLAAKYGTAFLGVSHLNKGGEGNALYRIMGSLAFVALARGTFLLTHDKETPERRLLLPIKNNLSKVRTGLAFSLVGNENGLPTLAWEEDAVDVTASDALAPSLKENNESKLEAVRRWLKAELADSPAWEKTIEKNAKALSISIKTLRRAKGELDIKSKKHPSSGKWAWFLPIHSEVWPPSTEPAPDKASSKDGQWPPSTEQKRDADLKPASGKNSSKDGQWPPSDEANKNALLGEDGQTSPGVGEKVCPRCSGEGCSWCIGVEV